MTLLFATALIVSSSFLATSYGYATVDLRKWGEIDRHRNIRRVLTHKLLIDPAYADIDSSGVISPAELSELYRRAGYGKVHISLDSSVEGTELEIISIGVRGLRTAVQSYKLDFH